MRVIAVYPGRFHPFHKGHAASFKQLAETFGLENTFLAISQKQEQPKSPFTAVDRAKMAMSLGIPKENIITVKNTYSGDEYVQRFQAQGVDVNDTALVFGVSAKDMGTDPRFTFADKKDGSPSYLQSVDNGVESPMTKHAFIMTTAVKQFPIAGMKLTDASQIRSAYAKGTDEIKARILTDLYGKNAKHIKPIFDQNLAVMESIYNKLVALKQRITESKVDEGWSAKYKRSINCSHPKGFSQKAHCAGKKKHNESIEMEMVCEDCGMCQTHGDNLTEVKQRIDAKCWKGYKKQGTKMKGDTRVNNCVPVNESEAVKITDYDTWSDKIQELGGEVHPQKDRNLLVAQSWDGDIIGKFHLGKGFGFINAQGELDETIRKVGSQYRLLSKKGKNLGTFDSKAGAEKHEREVQYFKHMSEDYLDE